MKISVISVWMSHTKDSRVIVYIWHLVSWNKPADVFSPSCVVRYIGGSGGIQVDVPGSSVRRSRTLLPGRRPCIPQKIRGSWWLAWRPRADGIVDPGDRPGGLTRTGPKVLVAGLEASRGRKWSLSFTWRVGDPLWWRVSVGHNSGGNLKHRDKLVLIHVSIRSNPREYIRAEMKTFTRTERIART